MRKGVALVAAVLLLAGIGAAVDRHGPMKTGLFEVQIDDVEVKGWQSVTIPGKSIEQDTYREGNDAEYERKTWGQPSFDDLEMERGVLVVEDESGEKYVFQVTGLIDEIRDDDEVTFGVQGVLLPGPAAEPPQHAEAIGHYGREPEEKEVERVSDGDKEKPQRGKILLVWTVDDTEAGVKPGATELHDWIKDIQAGKADEGRKEIAVRLLSGEGGKTVGAGKITVIIELAGGGNGDKISARVTEYSPPELDASADGDVAARKGRNPQTGKEIKIPASAGGGDTEFREALAALLEEALNDKKHPKKVAKFKPGAELSERVK